MQSRAVLDRIVDGAWAVLLVGDEQVEHHVPAGELPAGTRQGDWLRVTFGGGRIVSIEADPEASAAARLRVRSKLEALRRRGRRGEQPPSPGAQDEN